MHTLKLAWTWGTTLSLALLDTLHRLTVPNLRRVEMTIYVDGEASPFLDGMEVATKVIMLCGHVPYSVSCVAFESPFEPGVEEVQGGPTERLKDLVSIIRRTAGDTIEITTSHVTRDVWRGAHNAGSLCW